MRVDGLPPIVVIDGHTPCGQAEGPADQGEDVRPNEVNGSSSLVALIDPQVSPPQVIGAMVDL